MSGFKKLIKSPLVHIALATGISIIMMAYFSKRVLPESIGYLPMAVPPFLMTIHGAFSDRYKNSRIWMTWYWVAAIFFSTAVIIVLSWI